MRVNSSVTHLKTFYLGISLEAKENFPDGWYVSGLNFEARTFETQRKRASRCPATSHS